MNTIILKGKSSKGKNRIAQHGVTWEKVDCRPSLPRLGEGPWIMVESKKTGDCRWIHLHSDKDFAIVNEA